MTDSYSQDIFRLLFAFNLALLLLLGFSALFVAPGTPTFYVMIVATIIVLISLLGNGLVIYYNWTPFD